MKLTTILGIILIVFGIFVFVSGGITYTKTEKVLDIGPIEATAEREKTIPLHPIAGGASLAAGIILVIAASKRNVGS
jgi:hypothetical protein